MKMFQISKAIESLPEVIGPEIIALSTKDNIEQGDLGSVRFNWIMANPPATNAEAARIREEALDHPMFAGSVVSDDGKAFVLF